MNWRDLLVLLWGVIAIGIGFFIALFLLTPAHADDCGMQCTGSAWQLQVDKIPVEGLPDMTEEECEDAVVLFFPQTKPFVSIECVEIGVKRQDL